MSSKQFLQQVTSYIRSKEARIYVEGELQHHLTQSKEAWINKGYSPKEAEQKAISEMGSASQLGKSMDKIHQPKWDFWIIGAVLLLICASFIPIVTIDFDHQFGANMTRYFLENKIIHILLAIGVITMIMYFDYRKLQRYSIFIYSFALFLLFVLVLMSNSLVNGEAMFEIGPIRIQAWTVLPFLLVAFAGFFSNRKLKLWQLASLFIVPLYLFMRIPNLLVIMLYTVVIAILFYCSEFSRKTKLIVFSVIAGLSTAQIGYIVYAHDSIFAPYQMRRVTAFLNPELYATSDGYLMLLLKETLANAGWFGTDTIQSIPDAHSDFALVQLIQAKGYAAGIIVIVIIIAIALRILKMVRTMPQSYEKLILLAAVSLFSCQSIYSMFMVFGLLPITGMPLPFISYGATPLLLNSVLIGFVLSVYRRKSYIGKQVF